jgi:hypothetical protein
VISTSLPPTGDVLLTLPIDEERPVSVVGDSSGWDPQGDRFVD